MLALAAIALPSGQAPAMAVAVDRVQDVPPDTPPGEGPRGTSGEAREDRVGYASALTEPVDARFGSVSIAVAHPSLPPGSIVEVTALDTGRMIVAMVVARSDAGTLVALSPGAARALGVGERAAVRVRPTVVSVQDQAALRAGEAASPRLDAPPALLTALRRKLPIRQGRAGDPSTDRSPRVPPPPSLSKPPVKATGSGRFVLQVAALSSPERAAALAKQLGGHVTTTGKLYRVQLGPFADLANARQARDGVARKGYTNAIIHAE